MPAPLETLIFIIIDRLDITLSDASRILRNLPYVSPFLLPGRFTAQTDFLHCFRNDLHTPAVPHEVHDARQECATNRREEEQCVRHSR